MARRLLAPPRFFGLGPEGALAILLTLAVALGAIAFRDTPVLEAIEGRTLDWRFELRGPLPPSPKIAVVTLDDRTLDVLGRWPVSRTWLARAVNAAAADGAAVIAFDLLLIGPERELGADEALTDAVARFGKVVVPFAFKFAESGSGARGLPPILARAAYGVVHQPAGFSAGPRLLPRGLLTPLPALLQAAVPAHVTVILDADGVLRRMHPVIDYGGAYFPSLHIAAARLFLGLGPSDVAVHLAEGLALGERRVATEADMRLPLNHLGPAGHFPSYPLIDLVEGRVPPGTLKGRAVLIGATAQGVGDRFATPFGQSLPGIEVFAAALDNVLEGRTLERSLRTEGWDLLAVLACGLLAAALAWQRSPLLTLAGGAGIVVLWGGLCLTALTLGDLWLSFTFPAAAVGAGVLVVTTAQSLRERGGRQRAERAQAALSRFVSPLAGRGPGAGDLGAADRVRHAAVMFVDMQGFTAAAEAQSPAQTMALMRAFHRRVEQAVARHQGQIDKFIGDGALAVFGAQGADPAAAGNALACARDLAQSIAAMPGEPGAADLPPVRAGIGIHLGPIVLGEVGGDAYAQMTVAGDAVNVASRLEALTRSHGVTILASDTLVEAARATGASLEDFVELPMQEIRGRRRPLGVWAWPAPKAAPKPAPDGKPL